LGRWSGFESERALTACRQSQRKHHKFKARREGSVRQSSGAVDCYVTVKGSSVRRELTCCQNRTHSSQVRERAIQRGNGVGFSPGKRSLPAGKVGANTTSSEVGGKRLVSHPVGAMDCYVTVQESGRAAHPARSVVPDCAGDEMDCGVRQKYTTTLPRGR
jgi:hypothetical protein